MKTSVILLVIIIFSSEIIFSQDKFWEQTTIPDAGTLFTLAVNSNGIIYGGSYGGIFRSTDDGETWEEKKIPGTYYIDDIVINKKNEIYVNDWNNIFYSSDNGEDWSSITNNLQDFSIYDIAVNDSNYIFISTSENIIYRSTNNGLKWDTVCLNLPTNVFSIISKPGGYVFAAGGFNDGLFYRSTDYGKNWENISFNTWGFAINCIGLDNYGDIYCLTDGTSTGIYISTDNGDNWTIGWYGGTAITFNNLNYLFLCNEDFGFIRSIDKGKNWTRIFNGITEEWWPAISPIYFYDIAAIPNGKLFASTSKGTFYSLNNGDDWNLVSGIKSCFVNDIKIDNDGSLLLGCIGGIYRSLDNGNTWSAPMLYGKGIVQKIVINQSKYMFAAIKFVPYLSPTVYRSSDFGVNWTTLPISGMFVLGNDGNIYSNTDGRITRSTDNGDNWEIMSDTLQYYNFYSMLVNSKGWLFGSHDNWIYKSSDNGRNWVEYQIHNTFKRSYLLGKNNQDYLYARIDNFLYRSTDDGKTWQQLLNGLGTLTINNPPLSFVCNSEGKLFVSFENAGVYYSTDDGNNWMILNDGLLNNNILCLAINNSNIIAGSSGNGIYRSVHSTTNIFGMTVIKPSSFLLEQNYPNPFNPTTTIKFSIPKSSFVTLKIYDLLGKQIATLVSEEKQIGNYEVEFDGSNFSSGVYFYRMQSGNFIDTKKFILLR